MNDALGIPICPPKKCGLCGASVSTRPDGTLRSHSRLVSSLHRRLGVVACESGKRSE